MNKNAITFIFPICDARVLLEKETSKLKQPPWPIPIPNLHFIRFFGSVKYRRDGYREGFWIGEEIFCEVKKSYIFQNFPGCLNSKEYKLKNVKLFRRFYTDGELVTRLEITIAFNLVIYNYSSANDNIRENIIEKVLEKIFASKITIKLNGISHTKNFLESRNEFSKRLLEATSSSKFQEYEKWWTTVGEVMAFVSTEESKLPSFLNFSAQHIEHFKDKGLSLYQQNIFFKNQKIKVWYVKQKKRFNNYDFLRNLRINLVRLHSEKECFKIIIQHILSYKITIKERSSQSDTLQNFINKKSLLFTTSNKDSIEKDSLNKYALSIERMISEADTKAILYSLEHIRKNIFRKIETFLDNQEKANQIFDKIQHRNIEEIRLKVKELVSKGMSNVAISIMLKYCYLKGVNDLIMLESRLNNLIHRNNILKVLKHEDYLVELNQINFSILEFITDYIPSVPHNVFLSELIQIQ